MTTVSRWSVFVWVVAVLVGGLRAAEMRVGEVLPAFAVKDAKEQPYDYAPGALKLLVVSYTMPTGKAVNKYLEAKGATYLEGYQAAFLADIHGMPQIGRLFALPKMKKYPHRILLADSDTLLAAHPRQEDKVTVFHFDAKGAITQIRFLDPDKELDQLFAQP